MICNFASLQFSLQFSAEGPTYNRGIIRTSIVEKLSPAGRKKEFESKRIKVSRPRVRDEKEDETKQVKKNKKEETKTDSVDK
jgi:hypothetical protein